MKLVMPLSALVLACAASGQTTNNWINPASARWDSAASWSLGILPAANQTVNITNPGYKGVSIDGNTAANFPSSMTISNLVLSAPANSLSTLLLNYAGLNTPLRIQQAAVIGTNGSLQNFYSGLEIDGTNFGRFTVTGGGTLIQEGGQTTAFVPLDIRQGTVALTNGNMTLGNVSVGAFGLPATGHMIQNGGNVAADTLAVSSGTYDLYAGNLYAINGTVVDNNNTAAFRQFGGNNYGDVKVYSGAQYLLNAGTLQGNIVTTTDYSQFQQNGGISKMQYLNVIGPGNVLTIDDVIGYYLRQGEVQCGTLTISQHGLFEQDGGHLILTNNFDLHALPGDAAYFMLVNGLVSSPSMAIGAGGAVNQRAGTNDVAGGLTIDDSMYYLPGGVVRSTYTGIGTNAGFVQFRGSHYVNGVLSISGSYDLLGGPVHVNGLYLRGRLSISDGYQQADFVNYGLTDLGGVVHAASSVVFGQVRLSTNALFDLNSGGAQLYCANSSGIAWTAGVYLTITNWHVNSASQGFNAVYFGSDSGGVNSTQLRQIEFANPAGYPPGMYPAQILATGEIVPGSRPTLQSTSSSRGLVLTWGGGYQLYSSTNVNGPYSPVPGATSPWTNTFGKPRELFILKGP